MKKIKNLFIVIILLGLTGCFNNNSMENINISTSSYPIEYVVNYLYGEHSTIRSIYPKDDEIINFEVTNVLLDQYSDTDLFIFNGSSDEKNYVRYLSDQNKNLMIIDVTDNGNLQYEYSIEELWLDPNNLLAIADNIRKGFKEYINTKVLVNEINENFENLKIELTSLDGRYYSTAKNATTTTIIVSDDAFAFLEKYGIRVISIDPDTAKERTINRAKELINNGEVNYLFIKYKESNDSIKAFIEETGVETLELYTMTNLQDLNIDQNNYITLMNQNLENLKVALYK